MLNDVEKIDSILHQAAVIAGATVLKKEFHKFSPVGVSGVVVIAESHLSIHTWPEYGYAACDVFTCGDTINPHVAVDYIISHLNPKSSSVIEIKRGVLKGYKYPLKYKQDITSSQEVSMDVYK
jgi:S-adenosylmethionine decarboxylase proenzyme